MAGFLHLAWLLAIWSGLALVIVGVLGRRWLHWPDQPWYWGMGAAVAALGAARDVVVTGQPGWAALLFVVFVGATVICYQLVDERLKRKRRRVSHRG